MKTINNKFYFSLAALMFVSLFSIFSEARGHRDRGWQFEEEVHFRDRSTTTAILNCKRAANSDFRCTARTRNFMCTSCTEVKHSDHSSYTVFSRRGGGRVQRRLIDTFDFYHRRTAEARVKCENYRRQLWQCRDSSFECTPCTVESHTDHSEFSLYELIRRRRGGGRHRLSSNN